MRYVFDISVRHLTQHRARLAYSGSVRSRLPSPTLHFTAVERPLSSCLRQRITGAEPAGVGVFGTASDAWMEPPTSAAVAEFRCDHRLCACCTSSNSLTVLGVLVRRCAALDIAAVLRQGPGSCAGRGEPSEGSGCVMLGLQTSMANSWRAGRRFDHVPSDALCTLPCSTGDRHRRQGHYMPGHRDDTSWYKLDLKGDLD